MPDIVTITFNPCIDRYAVVTRLVPDSKLQCSQQELYPGGGGINVARVIHKFGGDCTAIYPAGGYTGSWFRQLLAAEDVPAVVIETKAETRENFIVLDESTNRQYRFGMPAGCLTVAEWSHMLSALEFSADIRYIVASGSLPPGVPEDIFAQIARIAKKRSAKLIVDTSGKPLQHALDEGVFLAKPNVRELGLLAGRTLTGDEIWKYGLALITERKAEVMIISMGERGAWLLQKDEHHLITPPPAARKSTVGAGDSMVAGIALMLSQGKTMKEAAEYGVACGTAATLRPGTNLCSKEDADRFYEQITRHQTEIIIHQPTSPHYLI